MSGSKAKAVTTLEALPRSGARHTLADYVELLCLFNIDREMTKDVLVDRFKERSDTGEAVLEDQYPADLPLDEALEAKAEDIFRHLKYREGTLGKKYPFTVDMTRRRIVVRQTAGACRLYLFMLLASNLRYFTELTHRLTSDFEALGKIALSLMLPAIAQIYFFHGAGRQRSRYKGKLFQKLTLLSSDIFERVTVEQDDFSERDVGDAGLDLVGWVPVGDTSPGLLLCFAQCACTDKWVQKQRDPQGLRQIMTLKAMPVTFTFVPFCFRRPTGGWYTEHDVDSILIDRIRILGLVADGRRYRMLESLGKLDELLKRKEPLI